MWRLNLKQGIALLDHARSEGQRSEVQSQVLCPVQQGNQPHRPQACACGRLFKMLSARFGQEMKFASKNDKKKEFQTSKCSHILSNSQDTLSHVGLCLLPNSVFSMVDSSLSSS